MTRHITRRQWLKWAAGTLATAAFGLPGRAQGLAELRIGHLPLASNVGLYLSDDLAYLKERGIRVKYVMVPTAARALAFVAAGELDVLLGSLSATIYSAVLRGLAIKMVADKGRYLPGLPNSATFLARKDLYEKGIRSVKDFKGLKVATNALATVTHYHISRALEKNGLKESDVELVAMPFPDMVAAFRNKAIDACEQVEPFVTRTVALGLAVPVADFGQLFPHHQYAGVFLGGDFIKDKAELAHGLVEAYVAALRNFYDWGPYHEKVVASLEKHTGLEKDVLKKIMPAWFDINGDINEEDIREQQDWYAKKGFLSQRLDMARLIDIQYLEAAWKKLGKKATPKTDYWQRVRPA